MFIFYLHRLPILKKQQILSKFVLVARLYTYKCLRILNKLVPINNSDDITQSHDITFHNDSQLIINTSTRPRMTVMAASTHPQACEVFYDYLYLAIPSHLLVNAVSELPT